MTQYLREILYLLGGDRRKLPWLALLFLGSSLLDLIGVGLVGPYVALVVNPRALDGPLGDIIEGMGLARQQDAALVLLGLFLIGVFLLKAVAAIGVLRVIIRFSQNQQARLQSVLMHSYQRLPYAQFLQRNSSEYVYAIETLAADFAHLVQVGLRAVSDAIVTLVLLALLAWQNAPALALLVALLLAIVYGYDRAFRKNLRSYGERANQAATTIVQGIHEGMEGLREIRILGKERHFHRMVHEGARDHARFHTLAQVITITPRYLLEFTIVAFVVILVLFVLLLGHDLSALIPTLGIFGVASLRLVPAATTLSGSITLLRYSRDSISRLHRDITALSEARLETTATAEGVTPEPFRTLVLNRIQYTYPNSTEAVLQDLSLQIRANESVGLVGPSGSGKTTLVDVLLGLLEPQRGELLYNGRPLQDALAQWRAQVAYLPQQVFLVDDTLRANVALGVESGGIDDERLRKALGQARLTELVAQLPEGVGTNIGERGVRLSGGQRQRVALARAFYHGRDVLVMDEATSALDSETEQEIVEEIHRLKGENTLIVIAHRLTTVRHCDRICRLKDGRIVEEGTYAEMFRRDDLSSAAS